MFSGEWRPQKDGLEGFFEKYLLTSSEICLAESLWGTLIVVL